MNWKMVVVSNWKTIFVLLQLGLLAITIVAGTVLADPIDNPFGP